MTFNQALRSNNQAGFSLFEVVVVLCITMLFLSLCFAKVMPYAKRTLTKMEMQQVSLAIHMHKCENGNFITNLNQLVPTYLDNCSNNNCLKDEFGVNYVLHANSHKFCSTSINYCVDYNIGC